jgi:hypothetical protein
MIDYIWANVDKLQNWLILCVAILTLYLKFFCIYLFVKYKRLKELIENE